MDKETWKEIFVCATLLSVLLIMAFYSGYKTATYDLSQQGIIIKDEK